MTLKAFELMVKQSKFSRTEKSAKITLQKEKYVKRVFIRGVHYYPLFANLKRE
jgi:hypothetical protein